MSENESSKQIFEFRQRVFLLIDVGFFVLALLTGIFALITSGTYTTGAFLLSIFTAISFVIVKLNKINFGYSFFIITTTFANYYDMYALHSAYIGTILLIGILICSFLKNVKLTTLLFICDVVVIIIFASMGILSFVQVIDPLTKIALVNNITALLPLLILTYLFAILQSQKFFSIFLDQKAAVHSNAYNRSLIEASLDPMVIISPEGSISDLNAASEKITGYLREELIGSDFSSYFTNPKLARQGYLEAFEKNQVTNYPLEIQHKDGHITPVLYNVSIYNDEKGQIAGVYATARNISLEKKSEERYYKLINTMGEGVWVIDPAGITTYVNPKMAHMLGYTEHEMIGNDMFSFMEEDKILDAKKLLARRSQGISEQFEFQYLKKDGTKIDLLFEATPMFDDGNKFIGALRCVTNITERKKIEERIREDEEQLRANFDQSAVGIANVSTENLMILRANKKFCEMLGYTEEELLTLSVPLITYPDDLESNLNTANQIITGQKNEFIVEKRYLRKDNSVIWTKVHSNLIRDKEGNPNYFMSILEDITDKKITEDQLLANEEQLRASFEQSAVGIVNVSAENLMIIKANKKFCDMIGYSEEEIVTLSIPSITYSDDLDDNLNRINLSLSGESDELVFEKRYVRKDQNIIWVNLYSTLIKDKVGNPNYFMSIIEDVTDKKLAEDQLRANEAQLRATIEQTTVGIVNIGLDGRYLYVNPAFCEMVDYSEKELLHLNVQEITFPDDRDQINSNIEQVQYDVNLGPIERRYIRKDKSIIWIRASIAIVKNIEGNPDYIVAVIEDITQHKIFEEKLQQANAYNRSLLEASLDPLMTISSEGLITDVNAATEKVTGYSRIDLIGSDFSDYFTDPKRAKEGYIQVFNEGRLIDYALDIQHKDGHLTPVLYNASTYKDEKGNVIGVFAAARDITERKISEQKIADETAHIMALNKELEAFSYSVSHDLRTPLRAIDGFSQVLLEDYADKLDDEGKDYLERIRTATRKMGDLINDLLMLSRIPRLPFNQTSVNLSEIVNEIAQELQTRNPERLASFDIQSDIIADCDPTLIRSVFQNLLENSWKFTSKHSEVHIEFGTIDLDGEKVYFVRDDGAGFDMEYAGKLFKAFQRLHSVNEFEGTGIGLVTVQRIINRHGGRIWAEGAVEKGATFYFTLKSK